MSPWSRRLLFSGSLVLLARLLAPVVGDVTPAAAGTVSGASTWSGSSASRLSVTLDRPPGTAAGDVMVAQVVVSDDDPFTAPAGWTVVSDRAIGNTLRQSVYVRAAGPTEPGSYTWRLNGYRRIAGGITTYSGVDTANPVDVVAASVTTTASTAVPAPSVTTTVADAVLVHLAAINADAALTAPDGLTERWEATSPNAANTRDALAASSDAVQSAVGATGPRIATVTAPGRSIATLVALRPAGSPPPPDPDPPGGDPVLVGAGDIATCTGNGDEATAALLDTIPGTVFTIGDNAYIDGNASEFANCYEPSWGRHKPRTTIAVAGNHDYNTPGALPYYSYFGAAAGDPAKGYYEKTVGAWQVIVLNSNCDKVGGCGVGSPQEQWLRATLAASDAECTVALWHHPGFSSATVHRSDPVYNPFWQALYDHGAEVVLVGSDHVYERFGFQTPAGDADAVFGLRQFTVGTGGRSHQSFRTPLPNSEVRHGATYGVLKLTLHEDSYDWQFVPEAGRTFTDSGTSACHGAPPPPPPDAGPIAKVGTSSSGSSSSRTSISLSRPVGTSAGHVMVASIASNDDPGFSAPAGWTLVRDDSVAGRLRQAVYVKVAGPSEPTSYTWTLPEWRRVAGGITTYSGVDTTQPVDAHAAATDATNGTAVTAPSVTATVPDTLLVHFAAINAEGSLAPPPGMTEGWEARSPNSTKTISDALASSSDSPASAAGGSGPRTATAANAGPRIGVLLALRPAS
jgi:hypothetical protein